MRLRHNPAMTETCSKSWYKSNHDDRAFVSIALFASEIVLTRRYERCPMLVIDLLLIESDYVSDMTS